MGAGTYSSESVSESLLFSYVSSSSQNATSPSPDIFTAKEPAYAPRVRRASALAHKRMRSSDHAVKMADAEDDEQFLYGGKWVSSLCFCLIDDQIALVLETCHTLLS